MKHIIFKINLGEISHEIWNSTKYLHTYILLGKNIIWINDITDSLQICLNFVKTQNCTVSSGFWPLIFLIYLGEIPRESRNSNNNRICNHDSQKNRYKLFFLNFVKTQHCTVSSRMVLNEHLGEGQGAITMENLTRWSLLLLVNFSFFRHKIMVVTKLPILRNWTSERNFDATFWRVLLHGCPCLF